MNQRQKVAITSFGTAISELKNSGVIRSHRYLGDLAEFLCADAFSIDLATNLRQTGHDGMRDQLRAQIKYGGGTKTNVDLGDPSSYEEIYVVLGKESVVRSHPHDADFLIYKLTSKEVLAMGKTKKGKYSCGSAPFCHAPDEEIYLTIDSNA
jgi:hypothetical protein